MNIGILVYSNTGNTLSVCDILKSSLIKNNHNVDIKGLNDNYDINDYDILIFASPVNGFTAAEVFKNYLNSFNNLSKKPFMCFVTQFFPYDWMGGKQAIASIKAIACNKNGKFINSGIIHWKKRNRDQQINNLVSSFLDSINILKQNI